MFTIEIPVWLQWAGLGLAVAYALPKALRALIVAFVYVSCVVLRAWPMRIRGEEGEAKLRPKAAVGKSNQVFLDVIGWAFGDRPVFTEAEMAANSDEDRFAAGDVVQLRSGGPSLTVGGTERKPDGSVAVQVDWFDGSASQRTAYPPAQLKPFDDCDDAGGDQDGDG